MRSGLLGSGLGLLATLAPAWAQSPCDPKLLNPSQSYGYRERQGRCEGSYNRPVSASATLLALLAASPADDICGERRTSTHLVWSLPTDAGAPQAVRLQAESLRDRLPYRLETTQPPGSSSFEWPGETRCSNEVRLRASELAVLARTSLTRGGKPVDVLLPVMFSNQPNTTPSPPYRAILFSGRPISEVYVSLFHLPEGGDPTRIYAERPLKEQPYPARKPIGILLSPADLQASGLYRLRVSVEFQDGSPYTLEYYFFNGR
jgi:hypothetical protein